MVCRGHCNMRMNMLLRFVFLLLFIGCLTTFFVVRLRSGIVNNNVEDVQRHRNISRSIDDAYRNRRLMVIGTCTNRDISISQSRDTSSGIPQYIVQIVNTCMSGCSPSNIHLHCGWFASAKIVNPNTFRRIAYDDCLVNGGRPLKTSQIIRFTYENSFMYPLVFKSAQFC